ncbi:unnamed protein product [Sphenostylis stenocarpa]|uniref:Uncharacterized protein n=1 Tax=Sphenostylis stenocarpa TaxID=92480 RepID=A0AA86RQW5_9FABA|nr:unnamed protein product [Sphenostylis stenocarpa]
MTASSEKLVLNQLPQPSRPFNSYDTSIEISSTTYPLQQSIDVVPPSMTKEEEGQQKFALVSKLVNRVLNEYEKLPASFRDQINAEEMLRGKRKRHGEETQNTTSRGLQQPVQQKPERFKVRYVSTEEVVKDDDKKYYDITSESYVTHTGEPAESASTNWYNFSSNIPNLPEQRKSSHYNSSHNSTPYATTKKRVFLTKRVYYSTRTRGRSGVLQSLSRKLGRFKIRTVIVPKIASEGNNANK